MNQKASYWLAAIFFAAILHSSAGTVTPANTNLSADTAGGSYTTLAGPVYTEGGPGGEVGIGTIVLSNAPAGFVFNTNAAVTVRVNGSATASQNINGLANGATIAATVKTNTISITITSKSTVANTLTWQNVQVRPVAGTPLASSTITKRGTASMTGVTAGTTSFGSLKEIPGATVSLTVSGYPSPRNAGQTGTFSVTANDQFGNRATNYTGTVSLTSTDPLASLPAPYKFTVADAGTHSFSGSTFGTSGLQTLTATDTNNPSLTGAQANIIINAGSVNRLGFTTAPAGAAYKTKFTTQPVVKTLDSFGNVTTNGLGANVTVTIALTTGAGPLAGTTSFNIGMAGGKGAVSFTNLQVNKVENGDVLTASASGFTSATSAVFNVSAATLTVSATATGKTYDGATNAAVTLSDNRFAGDVLTVSYAGAGFANKNAGTNKTVTVNGLSLSGTSAANYTLASSSITTTANIASRSLTVTAAGVNKTYNATTNATVNFSDNRLGGDVLSATGNASFGSKAVGTNKTVTVTGIAISGTDAGNYNLSGTTASTTANITSRSLTINASGVSRAYNGTTNATVTLSDDRVAGDSLSDNYAAANFTGKAVGTNKVVNVSGLSISGTDAGNYSLTSTTTSTTANISSRSLTVSATGANKVYDGTTTATVNLSDDRIAGDSFSNSYAAADFTSRTTGTNKVINVTGLALGGADAGNYSLSATTASATGNISSRTLTISATGVDRSYNGTTNATVALSDNRVSGDSLSDNYAAANFTGKAVGTNKVVNVSGLSISGADAGNYSLTSTTTSTTANISSRSLTVSATGVNKVYDGNTTATVNLSDDRVAGDSLADNYSSAQFADKNVGLAKTVQVSGISASGADAGNYNFNTTTTATADITAASLTVTANDTNRVYGAADPAFTAGYSGFVGGDSIGVVSGDPAFSSTATISSSTGTYSIVVTNGTLAAANYTFAFVNGTLTITRASAANVVSASANPVPTGSNVTLTATLSALAPGSGTPTGSVQFLVDGSNFGSPAVLGGGSASLATSSLLHGNHTVTARYAGDGNFFGSTNDLGQNLLVNTAPTAGAFASSTTKNVAKNISASAVASAGADPDGDAVSVTAVAPASAQGGTVSLSAGTITYTPAAGYSGPDSFSYTLSDSYGATASGSVTMTVIAQGAQPGNFKLTLQPGNVRQLDFSGTPGASYLVEVTTNLASPSWTVIATNIMGTNGWVHFTDSASNYPVRYYRACAP